VSLRVRLGQNEWSGVGPWLVFAIALGLRLLFVTKVHPVPQSDFAWYHDEAVNILYGRGYVYKGHPTAYFPIGFPLFLAGVYAVFGVHWWSGVLANIFLNALTATLVYALCHRLFGPVCGWLGGILMAVYVPHIEWSSVLCSEVLFTLLFFLTSYILVLQKPDSTRLSALAAAGVCLGLACIVRPVALLLPGALFLYYLATRIGFWKSLRNALVVVLAMAITISPITIRNALAFHHFIPVSTNGGVNLWQGNNPHANGTYFWPETEQENPFLHYVDHEVEDNIAATHMAVEFIKSHPGDFVRLGFVKWSHLFEGVDNAHFWSIGHSQPPVDPVLARGIYAASLFVYRAVLYLSVLGFLAQIAFAIRTRDPRPVWVWLATAYYIALFFVFPAWDRMRAPLEPWLVVLAASALAAGAQWGRRMMRKAKSSPKPGR
jgi:4-amino-4-deoxy-L-arabinose transferase-like glycosyltransferase